MGKTPRPRNFNGSVAIPREWLRETCALSDKAFRVAMILIAFVDWDARHAGYGAVDLTHADIDQFIAKRCSRTTLWRAIQELIVAGIIKRGTPEGIYHVNDAARFLLGQARKRADARVSSTKLSPWSVSGQKQPASAVKEAVAPGKPYVSSMKPRSNIFDGSDDTNNLNDLNNESTGDFFMDAEAVGLCRHLAPLERQPLLAAVKDAFAEAGDQACAGRELVAFHATWIERGLPCSRRDCHEAPINLLLAVKTKAKSDFLGYLRKGLKELLEDGTDQVIRAKEAQLRAREPKFQDTTSAASMPMPGGRE